LGSYFDTVPKAPVVRNIFPAVPQAQPVLLSINDTPSNTSVVPLFWETHWAGAVWVRNNRKRIGVIVFVFIAPILYAGDANKDIGPAPGNTASDLKTARLFFLSSSAIPPPDAADVSFSLNDALENQRIAPLLLLPLVENAFKHGVHRSRENHFLKVEIKINGDSLDLKTINMKPSSGEPPTSLGMGLQNVRKRLELLYPDRYRLEIEEDQRFFNVRLQLQLK